MSLKVYEKDIVINRKRHSIFINSDCWFFELNNLTIARSCQLYLSGKIFKNYRKKSKL